MIPTDSAGREFLVRRISRRCMRGMESRARYQGLLRSLCCSLQTSIVSGLTRGLIDEGGFLRCDPLPEYVIAPSLVCKNDRDKDQGNNAHNTKRIL